MTAFLELKRLSAELTAESAAELALLALLEALWAVEVAVSYSLLSIWRRASDRVDWAEESRELAELRSLLVTDSWAEPSLEE